jgi:hypothetical protein
MDTLLGYPVPFPTKDLYIAVAAVALFLPVTVLAHTIVVKVLSVVRGAGPSSKSKSS